MRIVNALCLRDMSSPIRHVMFDLPNALIRIAPEREAEFVSTYRPTKRPSHAFCRNMNRIRRNIGKKLLGHQMPQKNLLFDNTTIAAIIGPLAHRIGKIGAGRAFDAIRNVKNVDTLVQRKISFMCITNAHCQRAVQICQII